MGDKLRPLLLEALNKQLNGSKDVAILYSGGFDSFSCLCLCLELGIKPHLYSFYLKGVDSHDIKKARSDAKTFNVSLTEVEVPNSYEVLKKDAFNLVDTLKTTKKTVIQCLHPMFYTIPLIKEKYVIAGIQRGRPWGLNQKGTMAGYKGLDAFNEYRNYAISVQNNNADGYITRLINENHICVKPYDDDDVNDWFMARTYKELNSPHAKQPIIDEFAKELSRCKDKLKHASYQVESGIREFHNLLLEDNELNPNHQYKSVVGVYNNIQKLLNKEETLF